MVICKKNTKNLDKDPFFGLDVFLGLAGFGVARAPRGVEATSAARGSSSAGLGKSIDLTFTPLPSTFQGMKELPLQE